MVGITLLAPVAQGSQSFQNSQDFLELTLPRPFVDDSHWDQVLDRDGGKNVTFGVEFTGTSPYVRNSGRAFLPASVTKVFTTSAALERLGPDFRYVTRMQWRRVSEQDPTVVTELTLIGSGDPTWGMIEFREDLHTRIRTFVDALRKSGVRRVEGDIRMDADDPRWKELRYPEGWMPEDETACYGALAQAFNLDINCAHFQVSGVGRGHWLSSGVPVSVKLSVTSGVRTRLWVRPNRTDDGVAQGFTIGGTWAKGTPAESFYLPIHRTDAWIANLLREELARAGVRVRASSSAVPAQGVVLETFESFSPPLSEIIRPLNKASLNMLADALFKTLGSRFGSANVPLLEAGREVILDFVRGVGGATALAQGESELPGFFVDQLDFYDGSGISRKNSVTTAGVMALLSDLTLKPYFPQMWESLPVAGVDGTLAGRMRGTSAEGILRAKTGTLRGSYNLAGYVPRFDSVSGAIVEFVPFVVLAETSPENRLVARAAQDRLGAALVTAVNGKRSRVLE
ncbi:MAG: D-alanyl-D-alanine carboxypeptidase/D-alanyl-D-alanine-endopeptidase [Bdellovibrionales bacterium GWB1_55_8]|nr:MAG: D-alanyl-D-alanine carboxypeptidase/D-alanyl-D-alanine-endopeptidase [Bdellovibrionales bacterium GWB1_55_8]